LADENNIKKEKERKAKIFNCYHHQYPPDYPHVYVKPSYGLRASDAVGPWLLNNNNNNLILKDDKLLVLT
jgi:hypothetical protein